MNHALSMLIAAACGVLSGYGVGGGSLLMVFLTAALSFSSEAARSINLLYFFPSALAALIFHAKNSELDKAVILPAALTGCLGAVIGTILSGLATESVSSKLFGGFLLLVGIKEILSFRQKS